MINDKPVLRTSVAQGEDADYMPVGLSGIIAATAKLKAVSRGQTPPDERDSIEYKTYLTPDKLLRERIRLDADKTRLNVLRRAARVRNLSAVPVNAFDGYMRGLLIGNPLASPLEEVNPMHVVEQARRVSGFGPGGIGSSDAVTEEAQAVHASQFGFISPLEGPECYDQFSEVYTKRGWVPWPEVTDDDVFACRINGVLEWHTASRIVRAPYKGELLCVDTATLRLAVTPNHRVLWKSDPLNKSENINLAEEIYGRTAHFPIRHAPEPGDADFQFFHLPIIPKTNSNQRAFKPMPIVDWCALMGWWLSEGSSYVYEVSPTEKKHIIGISQSRSANPSEYAEINALLRRMGLTVTSEGSGIGFRCATKQLTEYFTSQWKNGCYDKWIPEELFQAPVEARRALLDALLKGDGRYNRKRWCYCTVSIKLAKSVERLAIGLGFTAFIRIEPDSRPHVTTTNYVVSIHREFHRSTKGKVHGHKNGKTYGAYWSRQDYDGMVYCATVPGGLLHVRGKKSTSGIWCGNSSSAGIDVRLADGVRYGSDGRLYRIMTNRRTGQKEWVSHDKAARSVLRLPD